MTGNESIGVHVTVSVVTSHMTTKRHGQLKCVELMLQRGAKVIPDRDGVTPLELCAQVCVCVCVCVGVGVFVEGGYMYSWMCIREYTCMCSSFICMCAYTPWPPPLPPSIHSKATLSALRSF